jgi:hypothetical protein
MDYAASPLASYFRQAQLAGELTARQSLPALMDKILSMLSNARIAAGRQAGE